MQPTSEMISANPSNSVVQVDLLADFIQASLGCAQINIACADACLGEPDLKELARCIRLNLDCADVCTATSSIVSRQHKPDLNLWRKQLESCLLACQVCAVECEMHRGEHEHCRMCAEHCRRTEQICQQLLEQVEMPSRPGDRAGIQGEGGVQRRAAQRPS